MAETYNPCAAAGPESQSSKQGKERPQTHTRSGNQGPRRGENKKNKHQGETATGKASTAEGGGIPDARERGWSKACTNLPEDETD